MTDYLYGSARLRAKEPAIIGTARMQELLACSDTEHLWKLLEDFGVEVKADLQTQEKLREETLLSILKGTYDEVCTLFPDERALRFWLYQYDCNNLKAAIKGFARNIDPRSMMFDFGTLSTDAVLEAVRSNRFDAFPSHMADAAALATAEYARTKNPQVIDLLIDRACYADMLSDARESGVEFAIRLVRTKIDLTNLLICVRILRMRSGESGRALLQASLIEGGCLTFSDLYAWFDAGEDRLWERLYYSEQSRLASAVARTDRSLTAVERCIDNAWMNEIQAAKYVPYGPEVAIAYLLAYEYEVRNLRILFAAKDAGLDIETTRERIRDSYV